MTSTIYKSKLSTMKYIKYILKLILWLIEKFWREKKIAAIIGAIIGYILANWKQFQEIIGYLSELF